MGIPRQYIVTKLTTSGGFRHICSKHRTLREARAFVKEHRLKDYGYQPRIYRLVAERAKRRANTEGK